MANNIINLQDWKYEKGNKLLAEALEIIESSVVITNKELYLDYLNNYLTVERFAKDYNLTVRQAKIVIKLGKEEK